MEPGSTALISLDEVGDHKMGSIRNNQIYSMFNNLQCQLMTLQSTMVSLQMNQNILQSGVESITKIITDVNSKINTMQSTVQIKEGVAENTKVNNGTCLMDSEECSVVASDDISQSKKRKNKRKRDKRTDCSEAKDTTAPIKTKKSNTRTFDISSVLNLLKHDASITQDTPEKQDNQKTQEKHISSINTNDSWKEIDSEVVEVCELLDDDVPAMVERLPKPKRKRRKKNRSRVDKNSIDELKSCANSPLPKTIKMNLPSAKQPNNTKITFQSDSESDQEKKTISKETPHTIAENIPVTENDVQYVNGKIKQRKGLYVTEILKQIRAEVEDKTDKSILEQASGSPEIPKNVNVDSDHVMDIEEETVNTKIDPDQSMVQPNKDYNSYPILHGFPRVNDKIAYKVLELSETYNPEISAYKEAVVINCDGDQKCVCLKIDEERKAKQKRGKFDLNLDEEKEETNNNTIQLTWSELIEPRLLC